MIIFGGLVGWAASIFMGSKKGCITNVILGILGSALGTFLMAYLVGKSVRISMNLYSFAVAFVGAVILIGALNLIKKR